jgi:hypothetical protein
MQVQAAKDKFWFPSYTRVDISTYFTERLSPRIIII